MSFGVSQFPMKAMGDFLNRIYTLQNIHSLYQVLVAGLDDLVAGTNVFIGEHDMRRTLVAGCAVKHLFTTPEFITIVNSCAGQHPLWTPIREGGQEVRCISDFATAQSWQNTSLFREALGLEGVRDHISIEFGNRRGDLTSVGVFRDRRGFTERDRNVMGFLIPHIEQALGNARLAESIGLVGILPASGGQTACVTVNADGQPEPLNREARTILGKFYPTSSMRYGQLPVAVRDWLQHGREVFRRGGLPQAIQPMVVNRFPWRLKVVLARRPMFAGALVILALSPMTAMNASSLSPCEREVMMWVHEGKTNDEIAAILGNRVSTIKSHLKNIFHKLGVDNRTAAARHWKSVGNELHQK